MFGSVDQCKAIDQNGKTRQELGPSPDCKPKLQQAGIYYLVINMVVEWFDLKFLLTKYTIPYLQLSLSSL